MAAVGVDPPRVSVVVPCRGHAQELARCLESLERQEAPHEVVVVDAAADPEVARVASGSGARIVRAGGHATAGCSRSAGEETAGDRVQEIEKTLLPGAARNLGARESRGRVLMFIDADCTAEPGWLAAAEAGLAAGAYLVGGPVLDTRPFRPVAATDNLLQFADFTAGRSDGPATYFPGCNLAMTRETFDELGGFPDDLPAGEDGALSDTALSRWPDALRYVNAMRVRHLGRTTLGEMWRHQRGFGRARGSLGLRLRPTHRRLGRSAWWIGPVVLKRLAYITRALARDEPRRLPVVVLMLPLLVFGLLAWALGFHEGCRAATRPEGEHP